MCTHRHAKTGKKLKYADYHKGGVLRLLGWNCPVPDLNTKLTTESYNFVTGGDTFPLLCRTFPFL